MNIIINEKRIENKCFSCFTSHYDNIFLSIVDDFEDYNEFKLSEKNIEKLFNIISYSWDGEIYWFRNEYKDVLLSTLKEWFKKESNHEESDDLGICNCFLIKYTPNGIAIIDTQTDMSSKIESFLSELKSKIENLEYYIYSDSHLIDHIYLGRKIVKNEFEDFYFMYKEKIISHSFLFSYIDDYYKEYIDIIPKNKNIVLTGTFYTKREDIIECLSSNGYNFKDKINEDSWLWIGEKPGNNKIVEANKKGIKVSTIDEIIDMAYNNYLNNKKNLTLKM